MQRRHAIILVSVLLVLALGLAGAFLFLPAWQARDPQAIPTAPASPGAASASSAAASDPASAAAAGAPAASAAGLASIRVGSYNLAIFGSTKVARTATLAILARIAQTYDLLAVQEVGSNASTAGDEACEAVLEAFVARINEDAGPGVYAFVRGDQYAFIYRQDKLTAAKAGLYEGREAFTYRPLLAYFQVKDRPLDFLALTIHTRPGLAKAEVPALARAMDELASSLGEADVLCLGDFNADGSYYAEGPGQSLAGFPEARYVTLIPNEADTTVAAASLAYDRMEASASLREDWTGAWGVVRPGSLWDLSACEGGADSAGTERALSDHYPVWAEFSALRDTD